MFLNDASKRVSIHREGIRYRGLIAVTEIPWQDVDEYYFGIDESGFGAVAIISVVAGLIAMVRQTKTFQDEMSLVVKARKRGHSIRVDTQYQHGEDAIKAILREIEPRIVERALAEVEKSGASFGHLFLTKAALRYKDTTLPLREIAWVQYHRFVEVHEQGRTFDAYSVFARRKVPNVFALLEVLHLLGVAVESDWWFDPR